MSIGPGPEARGLMARAGGGGVPLWLLAAMVVAVAAVGWAERDMIAAFLRALGRILIAPEAGA
jgi:hypothetical protein